MASSRITFSANYEINAKLADGVEVGFFADTLSGEPDDKVTFIRVENGESDAAHGFLSVDFKAMRLKFGYDVLFIERPFEIVVEDDGEFSLSVPIFNTSVALLIKKRK